MLFGDPYKKGQESLITNDIDEIRRLSSKVLTSVSQKTGLSLFHYFILNSKKLTLDLAETLSIFLKGGVNINGRANKSNGYYSALHFAVGYPENFELTNLLVENGIDLKLRDLYGNTAFWNACFNFRGLPEQEKIIKYLFSRGASLAEENDHGISVETLIKQCGDSIDDGANPEEWDLRKLHLLK